jgi:hypothetical protein
LRGGVPEAYFFAAGAAVTPERCRTWVRLVNFLRRRLDTRIVWKVALVEQDH